MPSFVYTARDNHGVPSRGTVEAATEKEAVAMIRERATYITSIVPKQSPVVRLSFQKFYRIKFTDIVGFTRQLSTMVTAGLQLQDALNLLIVQSTNIAMTTMLTKIHRDIHGGQTLASTLEKYPSQFSKSYLALIRAGESSGTLDKVMDRLADNMEKDMDFRNKVKSAMMYPAIIMIAMVAVFFILMIFVVPQLTQLYSDFGADLPWSTQLLKSISETMVKRWWMILILIFGVISGFRKLIKTKSGLEFWDTFKLRLPIVGPLMKEMILVEFTRSLGLLVGAGVHILDALNILVDSMTNVVFRDSLKEITKKVEKGFPMGELFSQYSIYPPILPQMIKVGEETGKMDESLLKLSMYFERESDQTVKRLTTAIEPIIMVVLGVGVGFIVFSIITPIYNLTSQFK